MTHGKQPKTKSKAKRKATRKISILISPRKPALASWATIQQWREEKTPVIWSISPGLEQNQTGPQLQASLINHDCVRLSIRLS